MQSEPISAGEFRSMLNNLVLLPTLVLTVFAGVLAYQNTRLQKTAGWVDHTDVVIAHLNQIMRLMIDEETGSRGFLLNRDRRFLEPFDAAQRELPVEMHELEGMLTDNPQQLDRLTKLQAAHRQWLAFTISRFEKPFVIGNADHDALEGKQRMDAIRQTAARMLKDEEDLRRERSNRARQASSFSLALLVVLTLAATAVIAFYSRRMVLRLTARYRAMNAALASEREWFRTTLRGIGDAVIACDAQARVTLMNAPAELLTGWSESEATGRLIDDVFRIISEDTRQPSDIPVNRVLRDGIVVGLANHTLLLRRDGSEIPIDDSGAPIRDEAGNITGVVLVFRDVSDERRREQERAEELAARERLFRQLADGIPQLAWMAHPDGSLFWYNRRWYDYTGTTPEQMMGWGWRSVHDPAYLASVEEEWRQSIATGKPFEMVFPLRGADGVFRPFLTRIAPVFDDAGNVARWFGTNTDISAERATAEALRISDETLRISLEASNTGTFRWDAERGIFLDVGENLKRLFGLSPTQTLVSTQDAINVVHPEDVEKVRDTLDRAQVEHEFDMEFRVLHPDGSIHWLYDRAKLQSGQDGKIFVGACTDVTQRRLAEETLRKTEKLAIVGRMAASISHEINNPLAAVTNLMYLIECADSLDDVRIFASTAEKELARVSQIVTQTLRFHRAATKPNTLKVAHLVESALSLFEPHLAGLGIKVQKSLHPDASVLGNEGELRQVLLNLIGNAIDATRGIGDRLVLHVRPASNARTGRKGVCITVADCGHGMDPDTAKRIFEPFFSTKGESGTGLGLWISEEIIQKHHGTIRVRSSQSARCHGTVFRLFLPLEGVGTKWLKRRETVRETVV